LNDLYERHYADRPGFLIEIAILRVPSGILDAVNAGDFVDLSVQRTFVTFTSVVWL
jgi:hypothetical protein